MASDPWETIWSNELKNIEMSYDRVITESFSNDDCKYNENVALKWKFADLWLFWDYTTMSTLKIDCYSHHWVKCRELKIYSCMFKLST